MGCPSMSQARKPCWITFGTGSGLRAKFIKDLELKRDYSKFAETRLIVTHPNTAVCLSSP